MAQRSIKGTTIKIIGIMHLFRISMKITIFEDFFEVRNGLIVRTPLDCGFLNYANHSVDLNGSRVDALHDS